MQLQHYGDSSISNLNLQAKAIQDYFKGLLKLKVFRGYYLERRFVDEIKDYRDIIALNFGETEMEKQLLFIKDQLGRDCFGPNVWIGISNAELDIIQPKLALRTYIWSELDTLTFGEYWFNIKTIKFRSNEVILKIKAIQPVTTTTTFLPGFISKVDMQDLKQNRQADTVANVTELSSLSDADIQINIQDFLNVLKTWWVSIKVAIYAFMANDISKENLLNLLRFFGLLMISVATGSVVAIKYLGMYSLRLLIELRHLIHVLTPIFLSIIDVFGKIVGGFYILLAMIWRDTVNKKPPVKQPLFHASNSIEYNRTPRRAIQSS